MNFTRNLLVLTGVAVLALPACVKANSVPPPVEYAFTGSITTLGISTCPVSPCVEKIDFSFAWAWTYNAIYSDATNTLYSGGVVPSTFSVTSFGPLGAISSPGEMIQGYFIPFFGGGAEIDLVYFAGVADSLDLTSSPSIPPSFDIQFYTCDAPPCVGDFIKTGYYAGLGGPDVSLTYAFSQVPERSTGALSFSGLLLLGVCVVLMKCRTR